jgi:hypothetical protein
MRLRPTRSTQPARKLQTRDLLSRRISRLPQFLLGIVELIGNRIHTLLGFCWAKTRSRGDHLSQICRIRRRQRHLPTLDAPRQYAGCLRTGLSRIALVARVRWTE